MVLQLSGDAFIGAVVTTSWPSSRVGRRLANVRARPRAMVSAAEWCSRRRC